MHVTLDFKTPPEYVVEFPTTAAFGDLTTHAEPLQEPSKQPDGSLVWRQQYSVESMKSGDLEIPPLAAKYGKRTDAGGEKLRFVRMRRRS